MYFIKPTDPNPITPMASFMLALLCVIWIMVGLIGHAPWRPEELVHFGVVYGMVHDAHWIIPTVVSEPVLEFSPGYYWLAAVLAKLFSPWLALHDGARLASGVFMLATFICLGQTARFLYGEYRGWGAVVILVGCVGLLVQAHQLSPSIALLFSVALLIYGFARAKELSWHGVLALALSLSLGFFCYGPLIILFFIGTALALPLFFNVWRSKVFLKAVLLAVGIALPLLTVWPLLLYVQSPDLFERWWHFTIDQFSLSQGSFYYFKNLAWIAWPALPLALWVLWVSRHQLQLREDLQMPLVVFLVMLLVLSFVPSARPIHALPMLLPLVLLASASLSTLRRGAANALDWFGLMTFAFVAILMWWGWAGLLQDNNAKITRVLKEYHPSFVPEFYPLVFVLALAATLIWLVVVWRTGRSMRRAVLNWASGITLIWILAMSLWLPWLDSGKSYQGLSKSVQGALPASYNCVGQGNLKLGVRAMLYYFGDIKPVVDKEHHCDVQLIQGEHARLSEGWRLVWSGRRTKERGDIYSVYLAN